MNHTKLLPHRSPELCFHDSLKNNLYYWSSSKPFSRTIIVLDLMLRKNQPNKKQTTPSPTKNPQNKTPTKQKQINKTPHCFTCNFLVEFVRHCHNPDVNTSLYWKSQWSNFSWNKENCSARWKISEYSVFPPVQNHCSVFAEGSILQHLEPDSVGAKFHGTVPLPSVNYWIISHHKTNYSLWLTLGKHSTLSATKHL